MQFKKDNWTRRAGDKIELGERIDASSKQTIATCDDNNLGSYHRIASEILGSTMGGGQYVGGYQVGSLDDCLHLASCPVIHTHAPLILDS
jgi:hypothetical protein